MTRSVSSLVAALLVACTPTPSADGPPAEGEAGEGEGEGEEGEGEEGEGEEGEGEGELNAAVFDYVNDLYAAGIESSDDRASVMAAYRCLTRHLYVLGVELADNELYPELAAEMLPTVATADATAPYRAVIDRLLELRAEARKAKDFAKGDLIRDLLKAAGVSIEDTPRGARWQITSPGP